MRFKVSDSTYEKMRKALPKPADLRSAFGEKYVEKHNPKTGKVETITKIRSKRDAEVMKELMWPHLKLKRDRGQQITASIPMVRMRGKNGVQMVPEIAADNAGRAGLVEAARLRANMTRSRSGTLVRMDGTDTGHTHIGEPHDWQRAGCPGCQKGRDS